ncbi:Actin cytoskeleton-regulatory complex protein sla1 [Erysiphe neolycopersici]|uniref:Actin cytoskeleton-regulatory complex protein SLA1 n=1 Tax=Erysiphe neolycopersici TaxID=212602 RepID=A0A420HVN4_9PEZI|nr:Actin cytoskeleton-regulatory complex protein sla1 [Erysiphe neolycopersici]
MGFLGIYKAIYDYEPQVEGELAIVEGDILYILEKGDEDCWWKAKKKASEIDGDEPVGLVPNNYIEEAQPNSYARALYDYTRQTDEELSFTENSELNVYDTSDINWILVGLKGEYGFVPSNYIEIEKSEDASLQASASDSSNKMAVITEKNESRSSVTSIQSPEINTVGTQIKIGQHEFEASDDDGSRDSSRGVKRTSALDSDHAHKHNSFRSQSSIDSPKTSPSYTRTSQRGNDNSDVFYAPQGFHMYNINEMVTDMGRRKKIPTTLGINNATGVIIIAPEKSKLGDVQRWTAEKMTHYSIEGKHIFLELVQPNKSVDFHAGAKDTAREIVSALGELAGAVRAQGLRELILIGSSRSQKMGQMLHDFSAQEDNEVSVMAGDDVILIDDIVNEEWWRIRRLKDGSEGLVPRSYVQITGVASVPGKSALNPSRSIVEQNRLEEERLAKDSVKANKVSKNPEIGPGMRLPERGSSLSGQEINNNYTTPKYKSIQNETNNSNSSKAKPDPCNVRTWNDRSKSFSVEAQFLALKDGKINLHKMNGVKIAVPVSKMSIEDLEYVERQTGISLEDEKPLSGLRNSQSQVFASSKEPTSPARAKFDKRNNDWFQFFLDCEVSVNLCERYSQAFQRDSMDESVLPDIDATVLRTLGIREGDIIKIMRFLDKKFCRSAPKRSLGLTAEESLGLDIDSQGSLFSGPGGALKNNTRKGRPTPAVVTNNTINFDAFADDAKNTISSETGVKTVSLAKDPTKNGFEDDAWDVKSQKQEFSSTLTTDSGTKSQSIQNVPALTGAMGDLSLLTTPLEPQKLQPTASTGPTQPAQQSSKVPKVVTPSFFADIGSQQPGLIHRQNISPHILLNDKVNAGENFSSQQQILPHQFQNSNQGHLMISAPDRPLSAPIVNATSPYIFTLQPQATGIQTSAGYQQQMTPYLQNSYDPRIQQVSNGVNSPQSSVNASSIVGHQGYNQLSNQLNNGVQHNFQKYSTPVAVLQQNFKNSISPFSDSYSQQFMPPSPQPLGFQSTFPQQKFNNTSGINSFLPPPLQPTHTAIMKNPNLDSNLNNYLKLQPPQQNQISPLVPQKTGPPPPVKFGVSSNPQKLVPQPTGRRANLSQATPQNPFGF